MFAVFSFSVFTMSDNRDEEVAICAILTQETRSYTKKGSVLKLNLFSGPSRDSDLGLTF